MTETMTDTRTPMNVRDPNARAQIFRDAADLISKRGHAYGRFETRRGFCVAGAVGHVIAGGEASLTLTDEAMWKAHELIDARWLDIWRVNDWDLRGRHHKRRAVQLLLAMADGATFYEAARTVVAR